MKTAKKIGEKVAEKVKKAKGRIARKVGKSAKTAAALLAFCLILCGCSTTGQQPAKSQTQNNELHDCIVIVGATKLTMPKGVKIETAKETELPEFGLMTQMQSLESSGTETFSQTARPTNSTDVDTALDIPLNKGNSGTATAASGAAEKLLGAGADWLSSRMNGGGTAAASAASAASAAASGASCPNGNCADTATNCPNGNCSPK